MRLYAIPVGASLLAKNLRAPQGVRLPASSLASIAGKPAPTVDRGRPWERGYLSGRQVIPNEDTNLARMKLNLYFFMKLEL
ncbi:hypothetical protein EMIT0194P_300039 [Pseudomonas serbica]